MGPSGSGKSTLMNLIGCLDTPSKGSYLLNTKQVSQMNDNELARIRNEEIGFVFQTFNLLPRATALHNVELPLVYAGVPSKERQERAKQALQKVELGERMMHRPNELSGGQRQRVAIARAILADPRVLILDDATSSVDPTKEHEIRDALTEVMQGRTTIVIAHRPATIALADRIVLLDEGRIIDEGTHADLLVTSERYRAVLAAAEAADAAALDEDAEVLA
jgi:putative ABC transport system ATP-binding protein